MGKYNKRSIFSKVRKSPAMRRRALQEAQKLFSRKKKEFLSEFEGHPITQEIEAGATASNISGTLGGYGNLFSFIGFDLNPIEQLRGFLRKSFNIKYSGRSLVRGQSGKLTLKYRVTYPSMQELASITRMPWEGGSWLVNVERGISGFSSYMYDRFDGRSGQGFQAKAAGMGSRGPQKIRGGAYRPTSYMSPILVRFKSIFSYI